MNSHLFTLVVRQVVVVGTFGTSSLIGVVHTIGNSFFSHYFHTITTTQIIIFFASNTGKSVGGIIFVGSTFNNTGWVRQTISLSIHDLQVVTSTASGAFVFVSGVGGAVGWKNSSLGTNVAVLFQEESVFAFITSEGVHIRRSGKDIGEFFAVRNNILFETSTLLVVSVLSNISIRIVINDFLPQVITSSSTFYSA